MGTAHLFKQSNKIKSNIRVLLVHGYAEHALRYDKLEERCTKNNYSYLAYDHYGHGQSAGKRALVRDFSQYTEDLHQVIESFFEPESKNFIIAHSMGGLISLLYLQDYPHESIDGIILSGPALEMYEKTPKVLEILASVVSKILPGLPTVKMDSKSISRDKSVVQAYINDPMVYSGKIKAGMGHAFIQAQRACQAKLNSIKIPALIMHGASDRLIHPNSAQMVFDGISSTDKTLKIWEGLYHEIMNEPEQEQVFQMMEAWIAKRV